MGTAAGPFRILGKGAKQFVQSRPKMACAYKGQYREVLSSIVQAMLSLTVSKLLSFYLIDIRCPVFLHRIFANLSIKKGSDAYMGLEKANFAKNTQQ